MRHFHIIPLIGWFSVVALNAATVLPTEIGQIVAGQNLGLTAQYMTNGCMAGTGNCVSPVAGTFAEKSYDTRMFTSAVNSGSSPTTALPWTGFAATGVEAAGAQLGGTGGAPAFAMISDATNNTGASNFWDGLGPGTMVVPIGLSNVNDVALMLENIWGINGAQDTTLTFDFGTASNGGINNTIVLNLFNSGQGNSSASGELRSAVDCTSNDCGANHLANGPVLGSGTVDGVAFTTYDLATSLFGNTLGNSFTSAGGTFAGYGGGTLSLGAIDFNFGALGGLLTPSSTEYLVDVKVQEKFGMGNNSQTALSAITVDQVAADPTPEPSTVLTLISGLGALGLVRFRRKK